MSDNKLSILGEDDKPLFFFGLRTQGSISSCSEQIVRIRQQLVIN